MVKVVYRDLLYGQRACIECGLKGIESLECLIGVALTAFTSVRYNDSVIALVTRIFRQNLIYST